MPGRGITPGELLWPDTPEFTAAAESLLTGAVQVMVSAVWLGYEAFVGSALAGIDVTRANAEVERSITQCLVPYIRRQLNPYAPFEIEHAVREYETRLPPPAQAPEYDMAFVLRTNQRITWPLEAKVLRTDGRVASYVADIREQFLTCRYAPFSSSGAMVGYLMHGSVVRALTNIEDALGVSLEPYPAIAPRDHRMSRHDREVPVGKTYPADFTCHHILLPMFS